MSKLSIGWLNAPQQDYNAGNLETIVMGGITQETMDLMESVQFICNVRCEPTITQPLVTEKDKDFQLSVWNS